MKKYSRHFSLAFSSRTALGFVFNTEVTKIFQHFSSTAYLLKKTDATTSQIYHS